MQATSRRRASRRPRRTVRVLAATLPVLLAAIGLAPLPAAAQATGDPAAAAVVTGILRLSAALAAASAVPEISTDLPLTDVSMRDVLNLDTAVAERVVTAVTAANATLDDLDDVLTTEDGVLTLTDVDASPGAPVDSREWTFAVDLDAEVPVPLRHDDGRLQFGAGELDGELAGSLGATFRLRYDPNALPLRQFSVVGESLLTMHAWSRATDAVTEAGAAVAVPTFTAIDGFVEVDMSGTATIDTTSVLRLRDPNGRGALTTEDFQFGSPEEMFALLTGPGADDVDFDLSISSDLATGASGTVSVESRPADSSDPYAPVVVARDTALDELTALTRTQALTGFAQFTAAILAAEGTVDAQIPMLDASLTDLFSPGNELIELLSQQAVASIKCGAADTKPPSGAARPGQVRYCQAVTDGLTVDAATAVTWSSPDAGVSFDGSAGTVGIAPTANVKVSGGDGFPRLMVTFTSNGNEYTARSLISSVQELATTVGDLGLGGAISYDATNRSLEVALTETDTDVTRSVATGGTGSLAPLTGLAGLCQAEAGSSPRECPRTGDDAGTDSRGDAAAGQATLNATGRRLDAAFGIGLVPAALAPVSGAAVAPSPVTYLKPGSDGVLWEIDGIEATLPTNAPLVARIGFLQVDVDITDYSLTTTGTAARVSVPSGTVAIHGGQVSGAVDVLRLLGGEGLPETVTPVDFVGTRGLSASADLDVSDAPGKTTPRPVMADGTIDATWADLSPNALPTVVTGGDFERLRLLDLMPGQRGTAGAGTVGTTGTLVDPNANFLTTFGVDAASTDNEVERNLYDLDAPNDATLCSKFKVLSATSLECTAGSLATAGLAEGHEYLIEGDPTALRDVLIEDIALVLSVYATPDAALGADATLPLFDLRPEEISAARDTYATVVASLQAAAEDDNGTGPVSTLQGFSGAIAGFAPDAVTTLTLTEGTDPALQFETSLESEGQALAPLRVAVGDSQLRVLAGDDTVELPLSTESEAAIHLAIDLKNGSSSVGSDTEVVERVTGFKASATNVAASLAGKSAEYGATIAQTGAAAGISSGIALETRTAPVSTSAEWIALPLFRASLSHTRSRLSETTCTGADIAACLTLPLVDGAGATLTTVAVALRADESSGGTGGSLEAQPLAHRFLADGLAAFSGSLTNALDGSLQNVSFPMVGTDLDAGADIPAAVNAYAAAARTALTSIVTTETGLASEFQTNLEVALNAVAVNGLEIADVDVTVVCATACASDATVADVDEVTSSLAIGGNVADQKAPYRVGLDGFALDTNLEVPTTTDWDLTATMGIRRGSGPFLVFKPTGAKTTVDVLTANVDAQLPLYSAANCHGWARASNVGASAKARTVPADKAATARCIDAFVGKLPSVLVDFGGTKLDATVAVSVSPGSSADADGRVYLPALFDKEMGTTTSTTGTGGIDVYFESYASDIGFFDVVGTIKGDWKDGAYTTDIAFGNLQLDAGTVYDVLDVGFDKARKWLAPLNPVVDVLSAPIPVVNDLSKLVGGPEISTLYLLSKAHQAIALVINLLQFQQLIARLPGSSGTELKNLGGDGVGSFTLPQAPMQRSNCTKTVGATKSGGKAFTAKSSGTGTNNRCDESAPSRVKRAIKGTAPTNPTAGKKIQKQMTKSVYFSLPSISVPVLEDAKEVYNLLLDRGDATMLYVDLGHLGGRVTIERNFGPFMIGPVPVTASIGGSMAVDGRMAFGFDTRGLSKQIELLEPGDVHGLPAAGTVSRGYVFSEGFYIDDLEKGVDVPEMSLIFTIFAGAEVSIGFAQAGIRGGIVLDLSMNAFDPNGDGKIYTDEFAGSASGPDCAFDVSSGILFFLQFYVHIDLFLFHIDKAWDIFRSPRVVLFEFNCEKVEPVLAKVVGADLVLTIGDGTTRQAYKETTKETYTVRQLAASGTGGTQVEVSAFNLVQQFTVPVGGRIRGSAGDGDDVIRLLPGQVVTTGTDGSTTVTTVPFTVPATLDGGAGADKISTGGGSDSVTGGVGADTIDSGAGDDTIVAGDGDDSVVAGPGSDDVQGGSGTDRVSGGPGADRVTGGSGDDLADGGAGALASQLFPTVDQAVIGPMLDAGDLVVGGDGSDEVRGGEGSDVVVGGGYAGAAPAFTAEQITKVFGVTSVGQLAEVTVTIPTLLLPDIAAIRTECAAAGSTSGTDRDEVTGGADRDYVVGGGGADTLSGGGGADLVCGRNGNDLLVGDGSDVLPADEGADEVLGGAGTDRLYGAGRADVLLGGAGDDFIRGGDGDDGLNGGAGSDSLLGEAGIDTLTGDDTTTSATAATDGRLVVCSLTTSIVSGGVDLNGDLSANGLDDGTLEGLAVVDGLLNDVTGSRFSGVLGGVVFQNGQADLDGNGSIAGRTGTSAGDTGAVALAGLTGASGDGDCLLGGEGIDASLSGGPGGDFIDAGDGDELSVLGGPGADVVRGGAGDDTLQGNEGNDLLAGDAGNDHLSGGTGDDVLRGSSGDDLLIGGSSAGGTVDGRDELLGDGGSDVLAGGNASMVLTADTTVTAIPGVDVTLLATPDSGTGLDDQLFGGFGDDWAFGQGGDDLVRGGHDDDVVEGGPGSDVVQGDDGDDVAIGGSSTAAAVTLERSGDDVADGGDTVHGDNGVDALDGSDIVAGDNARVDVADGGSRTLVLFSTPVVEGTTIAGDVLTGGSGGDLLAGQSGDDTISGGSGDDAIEGDDGSDVIHGNAGDDAIVGGSSSTDGVIDADRDATALVDGSDVIHGDAGDDVIAGDNARLDATGELRSDGTAERLIVLFDTEVATSDPAGAADTISGGAGRDLLFGQGGNDTVNGGDGDDVLEGNAGDDTLIGDGGEDDLIGGGSSTSGVIISAETDRLLSAPTATLDASAAGLLDGSDTLYGGHGTASGPDEEADGADVMLGDNGRIVRTNATLSGGASGPHAVRIVAMADATPGVTSGSDFLSGQAGDDELYGQFDDVAGPQTVGGAALAGDVLYGDEGDDAIIGDQGTDVPTPAAQLGTPTTLVPKGGFVEESVLAAGSLVRVVTLLQPTVGGADVLFGGEGDDSIHAGAGADLANGGDGNDVVFGANGSDALWGDTGHDRIFGGEGADFLDVKERVGEPALWTAVAPAVDTDGLAATTNDLDTIYGGSGQDALQADAGDTGKTTGDRLIDWTGGYNLYLVCNGAYGAGKVQNKADRSTQEFLTELARSTGSVGSHELALVTRGETSPVYPGMPGNFTCESG